MTKQPEKWEKALEEGGKIIDFEKDLEVITKTSVLLAIIRKDLEYLSLDTLKVLKNIIDEKIKQKTGKAHIKVHPAGEGGTG